MTGSFELERGTTLGKYEILRKLAVGGMAEIYLARVRGTANFQKIVVLKRILPHIAGDPAFVEMFLDEARLAATLQHPNIADVYDVGEVDGTVFFTMEYVHGQDVRAIRREAKHRGEPIPVAVALAIVHGTAAALDYAHDRSGPDGKSLGLVHRDVSSSNVMVSFDGAIKLVDFGIADAALQHHRAPTGTLKGKTPYMSPEQCRGRPLDRRSDLFSLGVVMYELTVGRRPFRADNDLAIMEQIVHGHAPAPSTIVAGYPVELEPIVVRLLARDREARYATAEDVLQDLERFIAHGKLWTSSKQLGKYMRTLFADRIAAWEQASHAGVSLAEHVAGAVGSPGLEADPVTPSVVAPAPRPASVPGVPAPIQLMPTMLVPSLAAAPVTPVEPAPSALVVEVSVAPPSAPAVEVSVAPPPSAPAVEVSVAPPSSVPAVAGSVAPPGPSAPSVERSVAQPVRAPVYPVLRSRRWPVLVITTLVLGGVGTAGYLAWRDLTQTSAPTVLPDGAATGDPATVLRDGAAIGDPATVLPDGGTTGDPATVLPDGGTTGDPATPPPIDAARPAPDVAPGPPPAEIDEPAIKKRVRKAGKKKPARKSPASEPSAPR